MKITFGNKKSFSCYYFDINILRNITLIVLLALTSCQKRFDEDPVTMKFVGWEKRLLREWKIDKILINGTDNTAIIFDDSLKIFSTYKMRGANQSAGSYLADVKTYNNSIVLENVSYVPLYDIYPKNLTHLSFCCVFPAFYSSSGIKTIGPINNFISNPSPEWEILNLTKSQLHLKATDNGVVYELFFISER